MHKIHSRRWYPADNVPRREVAVYILHGTGEHSGRYEHLAQHLTALGYVVGAHDHIGHGLSGGKRGVIDPPGALVTQAAIECGKFSLETGRPPVLFGHSLGGVVATELVFEHGLPVAGLILSAPAFVPYTRWQDRLQVKLLALIAPRLTVERPYDASRLTHDENIQTQAEADPLNHGFKSASLVSWLLCSGTRQLSQAARLPVPTLLLIASDDSVVDSSYTHQFASNAPAEFMSSQSYENCRHEILNEIAAIADIAFSDIELWLLERFAKTV